MGFFIIVKKPWKSIKFYQIISKHTKYQNICPWTFMDIHQAKCCVLTMWLFMEIHEHWWFYVDYHENPCFLPWNSMNVHVLSWISMANFNWVVAQNLTNISQIGRTTSLALIRNSNHANFSDHRINCQDARAASVLSTLSCLPSFEKQYQVFNGLDGLKGPLLVYTNHINNKKHMHHDFLAPQAYLSSTSLSMIQVQGWSVCLSVLSNDNVIE